ncbi:ParB/RepB/Spo0J family partition protein [Deinococcus sp. MIMF12]|uniref:ParB/RepB/Spo0J family partition protein n=1 Tax=Deinococcus rhizophilus TaxID=3049544 RepID=A0ABT7JEU5_9DEIO|nr:ParB/RepB/Spo0J family partition protein [Deinococcus rhizophilus]MDL2343010.1 ParB/RepB/Spo0J family partition protein [Deinococcus rhizophilus]
MTRKRPQRDLGGLLGGAQALTQADPEVRRLPLKQLRPYGGQPRRFFAEAELQQLTHSVREQGVLQPLLVRPAPSGQGYEIAAGERRYRAALAAGLTEVPVLVQPLSDPQMLEVGLVENLQREGLSAIDETEALLRLVALRLEVTLQQARQILMVNLRNPEPERVSVLEEVFGLVGGQTWQSFAKNRLRMLQWPGEVLEAMRTQGLPYTLGGIIAAAQPDHRTRLIEQALNGASARELREEVASLQPTLVASSAVERRLDEVRRRLKQPGLLRDLNKSQEAELKKWMDRMPAWLREDGGDHST